MSLRFVARPLAVVFIAGLGLCSVVYPASTRVYAWPWTIAYWATLIAPSLWLVIRGFDPRQPLRRPATAWGWAGVLWTTVVMASALLSPFRSSALLWAAPLLAPVAWFFVLFDWVGDDLMTALRRLHVHRGAALALGGVNAIGVAQWLAHERGLTLEHAIAARNPYPLGHSNYTAGLAIITLPILLGLAVREKRTVRLAAVFGSIFAVIALLSSGSRGGVMALGATAVVAVAVSPIAPRRKLVLGAAGALVALSVVLIHPRTRAMLGRGDPTAAPNASNVQRHAMIVAGERMGVARPWLGWGPGTTPLVFPNFRAGLEGGAENVLQLHAAPVQVWAELGGAGVLVALGIGVLALRDWRRDRTAFVALAGYAAFSLFDWQLDVPLFGFGVATLAALLASTEGARPVGGRLLGCIALGMIALIALVGRPDDTPVLNGRALSDAVGRANPREASRLLRESLARNPAQEIAHFNLGWLLVVDAPDAAGGHFRAAAHLAPDKGGVYFGLALARLNAGDRDDAARAFALEAINDPVFLLSPWWKTPEIAAVHGATSTAFDRALERARAYLSPDSWPAREAAYVRALAAWLRGDTSASAVAAVATTPARRRYFSSSPDRQALLNLPAQQVRNERLGYPVLMRNLDLPPPSDLWVIQQSAVRSTEWAFLFPDKGWLPSPLLLRLLDSDR